MRTCLAVVPCLLFTLAVLTGCRGAPLPGAGGLRATPPSTPPSTLPPAGQPSATPGERRATPPPLNSTRNLPKRFDRVVSSKVKLTGRDLRPVDAWLGVRNTQWIIGEVVDVYASKEYFASTLTINAKTGLVHKQEATVRGDAVTTLTYVGEKHATSAMRAPRIYLGKDKTGRGLTVSARKVLRIRMAKTRDPARPVQLRIVARGKAVHGTKESILRRGDALELGGVLRRSSGRWYWIPVSR